MRCAVNLPGPLIRRGLFTGLLVGTAVFTMGLPFTSQVALAMGMDCSRSSSGNIALTDLGARNYMGEQGGLYPGGSNRPPSGYEKAGLLAARSVVPLNSDGKPAQEGRIGFLAIGMSNASEEFMGFMRLELADPNLSQAVKMVDGAQDGKPATAWTGSDAGTWAAADQRLSGSGLTSSQVEVIWLKEADANPKTDFETYTHGLAQELTAIIHIAAQKFPNLKQVFISPRTYGGYGLPSPNPEPYAYQTGFADKFVIAQWVAKPSAAPWVGWGPYLWTNGTAGRADGLKWDCQDVMRDGTHPSQAGVEKVGALMRSVFGASEFTPWFRLVPASEPTPEASQPSMTPTFVPDSSALSGSWLTPMAAMLLLGLALAAGVAVVLRATR